MSRKRSSYPQPMRAVVADIFRRLGLAKSLARHQVLDRWPRIVGPALARHSRAEKLTGSTLLVLVDSSVIMNDLASMKPVLLEKLNGLLDSDVPPITEIRFRQRSHLIDGPSAVRSAPVEEADESHRKFVAETVNGLGDDGLKSTVARLIEKDRRLKHRRRS